MACSASILVSHESTSFFEASSGPKMSLVLLVASAMDAARAGNAWLDKEAAWRGSEGENDEGVRR